MATVLPSVYSEFMYKDFDEKTLSKFSVTASGDPAVSISESTENIDGNVTSKLTLTKQAFNNNPTVMYTKILFLCGIYEDFATSFIEAFAWDDINNMIPLTDVTLLKFNN